MERGKRKKNKVAKSSKNMFSRSLPGRGGGWMAVKGEGGLNPMWKKRKKVFTSI